MPIVRGIPGFYGERKQRPIDPWTGIYFVQQGACGPIKIGKARYPDRRLNSLQVGSAEPLNMVLCFRGPESLEGFLHHRFWRYRLRGEWFAPSVEMYRLIEQIRAAISGGSPLLIDGRRIDQTNR